MASRITVRTRNGEYPGELDGSDISNAIWLSNRLTVEINMLGGMMYGELPLDVILPKEGRTTKLETGDIAYWPGPGAFCIFFGPTLSGEDGQPSPLPMIRSGDDRRLLGSRCWDRQKITILSVRIDREDA